MFIIIIMMMGLVYFIYYVLIGKIPTIIFTMITLLLGLVLTTAVDVLVLDCYVLFLFLFLFLLLILSWTCRRRKCFLLILYATG